jgi:hypothetical protein
MNIPNSKRVYSGIILGAILGVFCIIGVGTRIGFDGNISYLIGMWYNRIIMGLIIGLSADIVILVNPKYNSVLRGAIMGLFVTTGILISTSFKDIPSFFAGIAYGVIIDVILDRQSQVE